MAHKIMQKYGFKEGQGLGKHEQGLSTALSVEKTSKRGGKIIIGDAAEKRKYYFCVFFYFNSRQRSHVMINVINSMPLSVFLFQVIFTCELHEQQTSFVVSRAFVVCLLVATEAFDFTFDFSCVS